MSTTLADLSYLERLCKGDRSNMAAFIRQYLQDTPRLFAELKTACAGGQARALALAAHDLRPHAHYMGAQRVLDLLVAIDQHARFDPPVVRIDLVAELMPLVPILEDELRQAIGNAGIP